MKEKNLGGEPIYDARSLGVPRMMLMGLQHMFAMFGATVLVPIIVNGYGLPLSIQTTLFFAGVGTLFFHACTKFKVPAFLGSSFAFLGGFAAVAGLDSGKYAGMSGAEKLPYALGGIVVAGLLYVLLAALFKLLGPNKVMRYFPPGGDRPHHHPDRTDSGSHRRDQRQYLLVAGGTCHLRDHCVQHLGQGHV